MTEIIQLDQTLWQSFEQEIARVLQIIDGDDELKPEDVKEVRRLRSAIDNHVKSFNKALTNRVKLYKQQIDDKLTELNYPRIEEYVNMQKMMHQKEISDRLSKRQAEFGKWVEECRELAPLLYNTAIAPHLMTYLIRLFPNVSSGAKGKSVNEDTTKQVLSHVLTTVNAKLTPVMATLPATSYTMRHIASVLKSGDIGLLDTLDAQFELDMPYLEDESVKAMLHTKEDVVNIMRGMVNTNNDSGEIIENVSRLLRVWQTKSFLNQQ